MIKDEGKDMGKAKDMGVIGQGRDRQKGKTPKKRKMRK
jgi:hypothetical protein